MQAGRNSVVVAGTVFASLAFALVSSVVPAQAQPIGVRGRVYTGSGYQGYGYPGGYGYGGTTAAQGYGYGMGAVIQAQGEYNANTANAVNTLEDAYSKDIKNRVDSVQAYYDTKRVKAAYMAEINGPKKTPDDWVRLNKLAPRPSKLSTAELDPVTGSIRWPVGLDLEEYKNFRDIVDALFTRRAHNSGAFTGDDVLLLQSTIQEFKVALKTKINVLPPQQYMRCSNFLDSLKQESLN